MNNYEMLTLLIAVLAIVVSMTVWFGQRKLQRESIELQRATAKLAKKQLEILLREDRGKQTARIRLDLFRDGTVHRFRLSNVGEAEATNVDLVLLLDDSDDSPIVEQDYAQKFPVKVLHPGASVTLMAAMHLGTPTAYNAIVKWINPDGKAAQEQTFVAL